MRFASTCGVGRVSLNGAESNWLLGIPALTEPMAGNDKSKITRHLSESCLGRVSSGLVLNHWLKGGLLKGPSMAW